MATLPKAIGVNVYPRPAIIRGNLPESHDQKCYFEPAGLENVTGIFNDDIWNKRICYDNVE